MTYKLNSKSHQFIELLQFLQALTQQAKQGDTAETYSCVSFFEFMDKQSLIAKEMGREGEYIKLKTTISRLKGFFGDGDLTFDMITPDLMERFECHLKKDLLTLNTISFYMRKIRSYYYKGIRDGLYLPILDPFKSVYTGIPKTHKRTIDINSIKLIKNVELSSSLVLSRDLFLFSFYTRGMSFIDIAKLKYSNINSNILTYYRSKTGQLIRVKLEECAVDIIAKYSGRSGGDYLFPILLKGGVPHKYATELKNHNNHLNKISRVLNLNVRLTSYVARHSWASIAKRGGIPVSTISECMGHSSEKTTSIYLASLEQNVIDEANRLTILSLG